MCYYWVVTGILALAPLATLGCQAGQPNAGFPGSPLPATRPLAAQTRAPVAAGSSAATPESSASRQAQPGLVANIAPGKPSRASGERSSRASAAFDDDVETVWNSGGIAPQWIEVELGRLYVVTAIELVMHQSVDGERTVHEVWFWNDGDFRRVCRFDGATRDRQTLRCDVNTHDVHKVQVVTTTPLQAPKEDMTWVAWREIRIWGYPQSRTWGDPR